MMPKMNSFLIASDQIGINHHMKRRDTMSGRRSSKFALIALVAAASLAGTAAAQSPVYLNLPAPPTAYSFSFGVYQSGQVVGAYVTVDGEQLFMWEDGVTTLIGGAGRTVLWAAINNPGQVAFTLDRPIESYLWSNGTITDIGHFTVGAINDQGVVAGCQEVLIGNVGNRQSVIWNGGDPLLIRPAGGSPFSCAFGINGAGQVAGTFYDFSGKPTSGGYVWYQGNTTVLDTFSSVNGAYVEANDINNAAQVVGATLISDNVVEAFLWQNGTIQFLGFPQGADTSTAVRIDSAGRIAGNGGGPWVWQNGVFTLLDGGACNARYCAPALTSGIANTGTGAIVSGDCVNQTNPAKLAACIWNVPQSGDGKSR